ncbi:LysR family transcriptional regulator [Youhaiella tibetensis]|uniref:HTH-type transcriptional regulator MetR n=1 Tax=Paradevosia tibetensis TaxID=1447062 RepID=A0A5B9DMC9_9HYPH|nr:LysR family transcriptional regulator [Youhaiella tibetensis]AKR55074.1 Transcriptional activator MetR [Devosia sp. H5989]QEE20176.1 LysR family transcriptional regulator [Youhaiella tibetensis]GGF26476.1 LysR family transcriptional regulator [Youhaiella tibetensis]
MIERQHLAIVREVVSAGSITAAAERLGVSQSALSHSISKLEERQGARIWERNGRTMRLTRAGEQLLQLAETVLPLFEHAERVLVDVAQGRRGTLRIGMECHPCERWLMTVTAPYLERWPDVDLDIRTGFRFDGVAALRAGEIDLLATPDPLNVPDLHFVPCFDYELRLVVHERHRLAGKAFATPEDFVEEVLFALPVALDRLDVFTRFLIPAQCQPRRRVPAETTDLMLQLVAAGRGVSVLPEWIVREDGAKLPITTVGVGPSGLHKSINLGFRARDADVDFITAFVDEASGRAS